MRRFPESRKPEAGSRQSRALSRRLLWTFSAALAGYLASSCGSGHATLQLQIPATVTAGVPFSATVTAFYQGEIDTSINGPIHFTTTDPAAQLPTLYVFTAADAGSHTFDLTLVTPGPQSITVSDYVAPVITGSANLMVSAPNPAAENQDNAPSQSSAARKLEEGR